MGALQRPVLGAIAAAVLAVATFSNNAIAKGSTKDYIKVDASQFAIDKAIVGVQDTKIFTITNFSDQDAYDVQSDVALETYPKAGMVTINEITPTGSYTWVEQKNEATAVIYVPLLTAHSSVTVQVDYVVEKKGEVVFSNTTVMGYLAPVEKVEVAKTVRIETEIVYTGPPTIRAQSGQTATMILAVSNDYLEANKPAVMTAMVVGEKVTWLGSATYNGEEVLCDLVDGQLQCLLEAGSGEAGELAVALVLDPKLEKLDTVQTEVEIGLSPGHVEQVKIPLVLNEVLEDPKP